MIQFFALGTVDLRERDGAPLDAVLSGPKRVALLAHLALARPRGFQRRDAVLPLLWPDSDQRRARGALRNLLHQTRSTLGEGIIESRGREEIGLAEGALWCDAVAFEDALDTGRLREALDLYRGDLMEGFHVPDAAPAFQHWLDGERKRLQRRAAEAAWTLAGDAEAIGSAAEVVRFGRRAADLSPWDEAALRRLLRLLERVEGPAGALRAYDDHARRLHAEWQEEPGPKTRALAAEVRQRFEAEASEAEAGAPKPAPEERAGRAPARRHPDRHAPKPSVPARRRVAGRARTGWRMAILGGVAALAAALVALVALVWPPAPRAGPPVIAVGRIATTGAADTADLGPALRNLVATSLAGHPELQTTGVERLHELSGLDRGSAGEDGGWSRAARRAGAEILIRGVLHAQPGGGYQLSLARQDLATGRTVDAVAARGTDPYALAEEATARLLSELGMEAAALRGTAATRSWAAFRFYEEGLRAYYAGDNDTAHRLLSAALAEDSLFAMAAYYRALSREEVDHLAFRRDLRRAARLAGRASDRERLLIQSAWAQEMDEPRQLALAETLAIRYPHEPDGHLFLGKAQLWSGDFAGALPHLRRVIQIDSPSLGGDAARCRACDALQDVTTAYLLADSLPQAEATARRWVRLRPGSARAWHFLARALEYRGRSEEALGARGRAEALRGDNPRDAVYPAVLALRAGDFAPADSLLTVLRRPGASLVQQNVLWYRTLSLREQGRFEEALEAARAYRAAVLAAQTPAQRRPWERVLEAQVLFDTGRPGEAAALWREMAEYPYEPESPPRTARHRAWTLTHLASALAAAGDTTRLSALADTIQQLGARSAYGRDPRLHRHVRGLLRLARGDTAGAVGAFREALFSPTAGYGRTNLELGRALLAVGRSDEAARVLGAALRGPLDAGNLYVSRFELHGLLARALRASGRADSARAHARWTARARRH